MQDISTQPKKLKVVLLGDRSVGKSSIITRFISNHFDQNVQPTVGVDFLGKTVEYRGLQYRIELWDTAGQQKYRSLVKGYLKGADACVFVYDCSETQSYKNLKQWAKMFQSVAGSSVQRIIVGNKCDKLENEAKGKVGKVQSSQQQIGDLMEIQCSAKLGINIEMIFEKLLERISQKENGSERKGNVLIEVLKNIAPSKVECCK